VRLAKDLPASLILVDQNIPYIDYFLEVNLSRSGFRPNIRSKRLIMVTPRVSPPRNVWPLESKESNFRDLYIHGKLLRNYLLIGEPYISLELNIQNPSQTTIKEIIVKLIQRRRLSDNYGEVVIFEQPLPDIIYFQNDHLHRTFQVPVLPTVQLFAPTSYYKDWVIDYVFKATIKTNLLFKNVTLAFPIIVGNSTNKS